MSLPLPRNTLFLHLQINSNKPPTALTAAGALSLEQHIHRKSPAIYWLQLFASQGARCSGALRRQCTHWQPECTQRDAAGNERSSAGWLPRRPISSPNHGTYSCNRGAGVPGMENGMRNGIVHMFRLLASLSRPWNVRSKSWQPSSTAPRRASTLQRKRCWTSPAPSTTSSTSFKRASSL